MSHRRHIPIAHPAIGKEEIRAVTRVLCSGQIAQGPMVAALEKKFAQLCGTKFAVALSSGTAALDLGLKGLNLCPQDEVITTPLSFAATANMILLQGYRLVFADINQQTFNLDPDAVEKKISKKTKAILPVDLYGLPFDFPRFKTIAKKHHLLIIEDACQAVGAAIMNKKTGSLATMSAFSLYASKNITAGEGGLITTNQQKLAQKVKELRQHGQTGASSYDYRQLGYNFKMTDIQAAIALEQLRKIKTLTRKRIRNAQFLSQHLAKIPGIIPPFVPKGFTHVFHLFTIRVTAKFRLSRDQLLEYLQQNGIDVRVYYPQPLHLVPYLKKMGYNYKKGDFPVAEKACQEILSLPVHPLLKKMDLKRIIKAIKEA